MNSVYLQLAVWYADGYCWKTWSTTVSKTFHSLINDFYFSNKLTCPGGLRELFWSCCLSSVCLTVSKFFLNLEFFSKDLGQILSKLNTCACVNKGGHKIWALAKTDFHPVSTTDTGDKHRRYAPLWHKDEFK